MYNSTVILTGVNDSGREYNPMGRMTLVRRVPWTLAHQASLSMGFPRQEYWNGLPFPSPGLPDPGIEPRSPALQADALPSEPPEKLTEPFREIDPSTWYPWGQEGYRKPRRLTPGSPWGVGSAGNKRYQQEHDLQDQGLPLLPWAFQS